MSASDKKRLRKEQNVAAQTKRQKQQRKEDRSLKAYTVTFIVVMVLLVAILVGLFVRTPIEGLINRSIKAAKIGDHTLSTVDLSYFYIDSISNHYSSYYNNYGSSANMYAQVMEGIDFTKPLNEQIKDESTNQTWADYYVDEALKNAQQIYALYDLASADESFKLNDSNQEYLDNLEDYLDLSASYSGASDAKTYLRSFYGVGANLKTFKKYSEVSMIASQYYDEHKESLKYVDADFRNYEADKMFEYDSYSYAVYTLSASKYLTGGTVTKDEDGKETTTYTDEEKQASIDAAKAEAAALAVAENNTLEAFNAAIAALSINKDAETAPTATEYNDYLYDQLTNPDIQKWLKEDGRKAGDITFIESATTAEDENGEEVTTINGYGVVLCIERNENLMKLQNVRHILVQFEGGTTDSTTGETTYTDEEKAAAKSEAQALLEEYLAGEMTEDAFAEMANEHSDDTGSNTVGGLYEDVYPGQMVTNFNDWCFAEDRQTGDTGLVETDYGYHVMYYVSADETTYRDYMINNDMITAEMERWTKEESEKLAIEKIKLSGLQLDFVLLAS